ncbi:MAG: hypothetical protein RL217_66 [Pseudomonadota bacterium]|jgi:hypothetical protein
MSTQKTPVLTRTFTAAATIAAYQAVSAHFKQDKG